MPHAVEGRNGEEQAVGQGNDVTTHRQLRSKRQDGEHGGGRGVGVRGAPAPPERHGHEHEEEQAREQALLRAEDPAVQVPRAPEVASRLERHPHRHGQGPSEPALLVAQLEERVNVGKSQERGQRRGRAQRARGRQAEQRPRMKGHEDEGDDRARHRVVPAGLGVEREGHSGQDGGARRRPLRDAMQPEQEQGEPSSGKQVQVEHVGELLGRERGEEPAEEGRPPLPGETVDQGLEGPTPESQREQRGQVEEHEGLGGEEAERKHEDGRAQREIGHEGGMWPRLESVAGEPADHPEVGQGVGPGQRMRGHPEGQRPRDHHGPGRVEEEDRGLASERGGEPPRPRQGTRCSAAVRMPGTQRTAFSRKSFRRTSGGSASPVTACPSSSTSCAVAK